MEMIDLFPIVFGTFKVVVLGVCMYFAIKWHHDQAKLKKTAAEEQQAAAGAPAHPTETPL